MTPLASIAADEPLDRAALAKQLDEATPAERLRWLEQLDARAQSQLWQAAEGSQASIADMVPRAHGALVPVIFHGKNSLPAFSSFQKRFCRPPDEMERDELWGYNYQPTRWLAPLTGPGYFVAYDSPVAPGSVAVDYTRLPIGHPESWPKIVDNRYRLSRFIYQGMVDYLRRVSEHLLIGRATRAGRELPNTFALCREDSREP